MVEQVVNAMGGGPELEAVIAATVEQNYIDDLYEDFASDGRGTGGHHAV